MIPEHWTWHVIAPQKRRVRSLSTPSLSLNLDHQGCEFYLFNLVHPLTQRHAGPCGPCLEFEDSETVPHSC